MNDNIVVRPKILWLILLRYMYMLYINKFLLILIYIEQASSGCKYYRFITYFSLYNKVTLHLSTLEGVVARWHKDVRLSTRWEVCGFDFHLGYWNIEYFYFLALVCKEAKRGVEFHHSTQRSVLTLGSQLSSEYSVQQKKCFTFCLQNTNYVPPQNTKKNI